MELSEFIAWIVTGGGAGIVAYFLMEKVARLSNLPPEPKRYAAFALSGAVAVAAWCAGAGLGYYPFPAGAVDWIEQVFAIGTSAFALSQIIHARTKLR